MARTRDMLSEGEEAWAVQALGRPIPCVVRGFLPSGKVLVEMHCPRGDGPVRVERRRQMLLSAREMAEIEAARAAGTRA